MKKTAAALAALLSLSLAPAARAADEGIALTLTPVGMPLGLGLDVSYRLSNRFSVRLGAGLPSTGELKDVEVGDVKYDMTYKLGGANGFVDWFPFSGNFHVSAGFSTLRDGWTLRGGERGSTVTIGGVRYPAAEVGQLTGRIDLAHTVAPAFLVGWGNPVRRGKRWGFVIDLGMVYAGREDLSLSASGPLASNAGFQRDLARERELQSSEHSLWPLLKAGVSFQF
jgi:hypothetical protein